MEETITSVPQTHVAVGGQRGGGGGGGSNTITGKPF